MVGYVIYLFEYPQKIYKMALTSDKMMGIRAIIAEVENNSVRLVGLPNLFQSSSKNDRRYAERTLRTVFNNIDNLGNISWSDFDDFVSSGLGEEFFDFLDWYKNLIEERNFDKARIEAGGFLSYLIDEKKNYTPF